MSVIHAKNIVFGTGRLTKDAVMKRVGEKNTKKVSISLVVSDKGDTPEFVNGTCWGDRADYSESLVKGDTVFFFGKDQPEREYNGKKYKDTDIQFVAKQPVIVFAKSDADDSGIAKKSETFGDDIPDVKMPWDD